MTRVEHRAFEAFVTAVVAPQRPLPPAGATDAARAFEATLAASPRLNRVCLRAAIVVAGALPSRAALHPLLKPLRALAQLHYYGDPGVMALLGYDAGAVLARAGR